MVGPQIGELTSLAFLSKTVRNIFSEPPWKQKGWYSHSLLCQCATLFPDVGNHCSHLGDPWDLEKTPRGRDSPPPPPREASLAVRGLLQELASIRRFLEKRDESREVAREWLRVGSVLDRLLFRVYLVAVLAYSVTLIALWSIWQYS